MPQCSRSSFRCPSENILPASGPFAAVAFQPTIDLGYPDSTFSPCRAGGIVPIGLDGLAEERAEAQS
jgi:hypothetical protein